MKRLTLMIICMLALSICACVTDNHSYNQQPQKIYDAVASKYANDKSTLIFIDAPQGFIAPRLANCAVDKDVDNGKVVAIASALSLKTNTVVVAGEDESLTASTLSKALKLSKDKANGAKVLVVDAKQTKQALTDQAAYNNVSIEFIDTPI